MPLYGLLSPEEAAPLHPKPAPVYARLTVDYERFCESHLYRVVGREDEPERRFSTLAGAALVIALQWAWIGWLLWFRKGH